MSLHPETETDSLQWREIYTAIDGDTGNGCHTKDGAPLDIEKLKRGEYKYWELKFAWPLVTDENSIETLLEYVTQKAGYKKPVVICLRKILKDLDYVYDIRENDHYVIIGEQRKYCPVAYAKDPSIKPESFLNKANLSTYIKKDAIRLGERMWSLYADEIKHIDLFEFDPNDSKNKNKYVIEEIKNPRELPKKKKAMNQKKWGILWDSTAVFDKTSTYGCKYPNIRVDFKNANGKEYSFEYNYWQNDILRAYHVQKYIVDKDNVFGGTEYARNIPIKIKETDLELVCTICDKIVSGKEFRWREYYEDLSYEEVIGTIPLIPDYLQVELK